MAITDRSTRALGSIADFEPIDLSELTLSAELMTRHDRKYLVSVDQVPRLLRDLPRGTRALEIDGRREFAYQSCYHDTPGLTSYHGAAHGRRRRFKVRTRTYLDSGDAWLEVKTRGHRGATVKQRIEHDPRLAHDVRPGLWFVDQVLAEAHVPAPQGPLAPVLVCRYQRTTLALPDGGARLTLDTRLTWSTPDGRSLDGGDLAIVETKTGGATSAFDRVLRGAGLRPGRFSKYATAMAFLHRALPANRWHRSLDTAFDLARAASPRRLTKRDVP